MIGLVDRKFRIPRIWSNRELEKFAHLFHGSVVNVSGWQDRDKEGRLYQDYFSNAAEYWITNYRSDARGFQGDLKNELFLDLSKPVAEDAARYDVVFNHTVLEHIFELDVAFANLCALCRDLVIVVVPFLQEQHAEYGDYWRFTPQAVDGLFRKNGLSTLYMNYNDSGRASIYLFAIGSKSAEKWSAILSHPDNKVGVMKSGPSGSFFLGTKIIGNGLYGLLQKARLSFPFIFSR